MTEEIAKYEDDEMPETATKVEGPEDEGGDLAIARKQLGRALVTFRERLRAIQLAAENCDDLDSISKVLVSAEKGSSQTLLTLSALRGGGEAIEVSGQELLELLGKANPRAN